MGAFECSCGLLRTQRTCSAADSCPRLSPYSYEPGRGGEMGLGAPPGGVEILAPDTQNSPQLGVVGAPLKRAATHCMADSPSTMYVNMWLVPVLLRNGGSSLVWNWMSAPRA